MTGARSPRVDPARAAMLAEVAEGLARPQRELSPKWFYDRRGSELFEEITRLPEYYLTRAERALLAGWMPALIPRLAPASLVELGAGSAAKTRLILDAMLDAGSGRAYAPVDVSASFLDATAAALRVEYPALRIRPVVGDIAESVQLPRDLPRPMLVAFLGSTIGNFDEDGAVALLRRVRMLLRDADRLLLGVDLRKDPAVLEAAYNDAAGVTAEFNRNVLRVLNAELAADFVPDAFAHRAFYDRDRHRIEMHLVARGEQRVSIPGIAPVVLRDGETIRTEISCKHDRGSVAALFAAAGLELAEWCRDDEGRFALALGAPAGR